MPDRSRSRTGRPWAWPVALLTLVVLAACTPGSVNAPPATAGATATPPTHSPATGTSGPSATPTAAPVVAMTQPWATAPLVDVRTGETFRIADMVAAGNVVIVETMAIWCPNCLRQGAEVNAALAGLGPTSKVVYVVLDVDLHEDAAALADYQVQNGFDGRYAIAGIPVSRALAEEFGANVLNPPLTPIVIVGTDGVGTLTAHGPKSSGAGRRARQERRGLAWRACGSRSRWGSQARAVPACCPSTRHSSPTWGRTPRVSKADGRPDSLG